MESKFDGVKNLIEILDYLVGELIVIVTLTFCVMQFMALWPLIN